MELLWQNGPVVMQSQNQRNLRKPPEVRNSDGTTTAGTSSARPEVETYNQYIFMQEGEMASWLHYPVDDDDPHLDQNFSAGFLNPPPTVNNNSAMQTPPRTSQLTELQYPPMSVAPPRPPIPPPRRPEQVTPNFAYFSRHSVRTEPGPSSISRTVAKETTVVDSCDTPAAPPAAVTETGRSSEPTEGGGGLTAPSTTFDEPGGSSSSGELVRKVAEQDRKRKGKEVEEWEYQSEVSELTQRVVISLLRHIHSYEHTHSRCVFVWRLSCAG